MFPKKVYSRKALEPCCDNCALSKYIEFMDRKGSDLKDVEYSSEILDAFNGYKWGLIRNNMRQSVGVCPKISSPIKKQYTKEIAARLEDLVGSFNQVLADNPSGLYGRILGTRGLEQFSNCLSRLLLFPDNFVSALPVADFKKTALFAYKDGLDRPDIAWFAIKLLNVRYRTLFRYLATYIKALDRINDTKMPDGTTQGVKLLFTSINQGLNDQKIRVTDIWNESMAEDFRHSAQLLGQADLTRLGAPNKFGHLWFLEQMTIYWYNATERAAILGSDLKPEVIGTQYFNAFCYEVLIMLIELSPSHKHAAKVCEAVIGRGGLSRPSHLELISSCRGDTQYTKHGRRQEARLERLKERLFESIRLFRSQHPLAQSLEKAIALRHQEIDNDGPGVHFREITLFSVYDEELWSGHLAPGL